MKTKKKVIVTVGAIVALILVGVPALLLFRGISQFSTAAADLEMSVNQLRSYYAKNPFPSRENIKLERENLKTMHGWFGQLVDVVTRGQVNRGESTPTRFSTQYNDVRNGLLSEAKKQGVTLSRDNALGFSRYAEGVLPAPVDVSRLAQQLTMTERLTTVLLEAKVKSVDTVGRQVFDSVSLAAMPSSEGGGRSNRRSSRRDASASRAGRPSGGTRPAAQAAPSGPARDLYEVEPFSLEFRAKEAVALDVLNRLARHSLCVVVTGVQFSKQGQDLHMPETDGSEDASTADLLPTAAEAAVADHKPADGELTREHRMVSGPDVDAAMAVKIDLEVYTFSVEKVMNRDEGTRGAEG